MELLTLTVTNLGVFQGSHTFDLAPMRAPGTDYRYLTIIRGHNGAGKSTVFQALGLALHGRLALGERVSRQVYNDFLLARLHRTRSEGPVGSGGVALCFLFVQSGQRLRVQVDRRWQVTGRSISEELDVRCNEKPPDVLPSEYQNWLNDLVPPGLAPVVFFDAEQMDALAAPEQQGVVLGGIFRRLLGLDLVERLRTDLEYNTRQRTGLDAGALREEVLRRQANLDMLEDQLLQLQSSVKTLLQEQGELDVALANEERRLMAEGGAYAAQRPLVERRLADIVAEIRAASEELHELSAGLLPFVLVPEICRSLKRRLTQEAKIQRCQIADELWRERLAHAETMLQTEELWQGIFMPPQERANLARRLTSLLRESPSQYAAADQRLVHRLSEADRGQLQSWIDEAFGTTSRRTVSLSSKLRRLQEDRRRLETDRQRAPDDAVLAPIHAEIAQLEQALAEVLQRREVLNRDLGVLQFRCDEESRQLQRAADQLAAAQAMERQLALAVRSRLALRAYQDALLHQRLTALESAMVLAFNSIARKEHLLTRARFNPDDFSVELRSILDRIVTLSHFSTGERQIYVLALLRALRQVSGRQLPLVIDTPLARLDDIHRWYLLHNYFPTAGGQVVLFVTDTELTIDLLDRAGPYLARLYRLEYDQENDRTKITLESRSTPTGIMLYRDKTRNATNDALNDIIQPWSPDPVRVRGNGSLQSALLPSSAKRLILVDPYDNEVPYYWPGIAEMERVTGKPLLTDQLHRGQRIFDLWKTEWWSELREAGYDSVATLDVYGPVEIVLNPKKLIPMNGSAAKTEEGSSDNGA